VNAVNQARDLASAFGPVPEPEFMVLAIDDDEEAGLMEETSASDWMTVDG
jgi:hypothetical protein